MIELINNHKIIDNICDIHRIVDAQNKKIISFNNEINGITNHTCFKFWEHQTECINCISMRALNENKSFSKIETVNDKIYYILAIPINIHNNKYVIELVKDITEDDIKNFLAIDINKKLKEEIKRLNELLVIDELTNTFNRRYINEKLPYSIQKLLNKELTLSIMMLDLDKFKNINDTYGHDCGDYVLKEVSKVLLDFANTYDCWTARYGGDEFLVVFENLSKEGTLKVSAELKNTIYNIPINYKGNNINISCSIGISYPYGDDLDINSIIKEADLKLYESKRNIK